MFQEYELFLNVSLMVRWVIESQALYEAIMCTASFTMTKHDNVLLYR